jgi:hypothetical protein
MIMTSVYWELMPVFSKILNIAVHMVKGMK